MKNHCVLNSECVILLKRGDCEEMLPLVVGRIVPCREKLLHGVTSCWVLFNPILGRFLLPFNCIHTFKDIWYFLFKGGS